MLHVQTTAKISQHDSDRFHRGVASGFTVDSAGVAGSDAAFDKGNVSQWGYVHQWTAPPRAQGTFFGSGNIVGADGKAKVPANWLEEWKWYHHMIYDLGASPTQVYLLSEATPTTCAHGPSALCRRMRLPIGS